MSEIRRKEGTGPASAGTASGAPDPKGAAPRRRHAVALATEIVAIVGVPAALAACIAFDVQQTAVLSLVVVLGCLAVFFAGFEHSRPRLRDTMPIAVRAALGAAVWLQIFWFVIVSVATLVLTRPLVKRYVDSRSVATNADRSIGRAAVVTERIDNLAATGAVQLDGVVWTARSTDDAVAIETGERVTVRAIEGVKLIVERSVR